MNSSNGEAGGAAGMVVLLFRHFTVPWKGAKNSYTSCLGIHGKYNLPSCSPVIHGENNGQTEATFDEWRERQRLLPGDLQGKPEAAEGPEQLRAAQAVAGRSPEGKGSADPREARAGQPEEHPAVKGAQEGRASGTGSCRNSRGRHGPQGAIRQSRHARRAN